MALYNLDSLKALCLNDPLFFSEMIEGLISSSNEFITEMEEAVNRGDTKRLAYLAHKALAPYRYIEANQMCELLKDMENLCTQSDLKSTAYTEILERIQNNSSAIIAQLQAEKYTF